MLNCSCVYLNKVCICLNNVKSINKQPLGKLNIHEKETLFKVFIKNGTNVYYNKIKY